MSDFVAVKNPSGVITYLSQRTWKNLGSAVESGNRRKGFTFVANLTAKNIREAVRQVRLIKSGNGADVVRALNDAGAIPRTFVPDEVSKFPKGTPKDPEKAPEKAPEEKIEKPAEKGYVPTAAPVAPEATDEAAQAEEKPVAEPAKRKPGRPKKAKDEAAADAEEKPVDTTNPKTE